MVRSASLLLALPLALAGCDAAPNAPGAPGPSPVQGTSLGVILNEDLSAR
jgi:hypothetical protein